MDNYLQQGITAAKAGDRRRAFELLTRASEDPATSEHAWLWLSGVVNDDAERLFCLDRVLRINPNNAAASRGATMLRQKGVYPSIPAYPESPKATPMQGSQPLSFSGSSQASPAAPVQTQTTSTPAPKTQSRAENGLTLNRQEIGELYRYAAEELVKKSPPLAIEKSLIDRGIPPENAKIIVKDAQKAVKILRRDKYKARMLRGLAWTVVGVIITCVTYTFAESLGGKFVLFYGAIIFGVIDFVAGLVGWLANS